VKAVKLEIQEKKDNPLIGRQEISFSVTETKATPSRKELREAIAAQTNSKEKNIIVDVLDTRFGTTDFKGEARVYENEEQLKKIELKPIVVRNFGKEEKKATNGSPEGKEAKPEAGSEAPAEKEEEKSAEAEAKEEKKATEGSHASTRKGEGEEAPKEVKEEAKEEPQEEKKK